MFILAELVLKSYKPVKLEPGMWFVQKFQTGTRWESSEVFAIDKVPQDEQEFINKNGYPVEPYIIGEDEEILASPNEIGWWDEGEETDEYRDITINDVNMIINEFDGEIAIDGDLYGYDDDDKEYAIHDTKMALIEASRKNITPFCLTVDSAGNDYLRTMCNDIGYEVLDDIETLPHRLPMLYKKLSV